MLGPNRVIAKDFKSCTYWCFVWCVTLIGRVGWIPWLQTVKKQSTINIDIFDKDNETLWVSLWHIIIEKLSFLKWVMFYFSFNWERSIPVLWNGCSWKRETLDLSMLDSKLILQTLWKISLNGSFLWVSFLLVGKITL